MLGHDEKIYNMVLLGPKSAGKTSFVRALCNAPFSEKTAPTIGVSLIETQITPGKTRRPIMPVKIWDMSGDETFQNMWPTYINRINTKIIIFCVDGSELQTSLKSNQKAFFHDLLDRIRIPKEIKRLLVMTKTDSETGDSIADGQFEGLAALLHADAHIKCSAKNGIGFGQNELVEETIAQLLHGNMVDNCKVEEERAIGKLELLPPRPCSNPKHFNFGMFCVAIALLLTAFLAGAPGFVSLLLGVLGSMLAGVYLGRAFERIAVLSNIVETVFLEFAWDKAYFLNRLLLTILLVSSIILPLLITGQLPITLGLIGVMSLLAGIATLAMKTLSLDKEEAFSLQIDRSPSVVSHYSYTGDRSFWGANYNRSPLGDNRPMNSGADSYKGDVSDVQGDTNKNNFPH